MKKINQALTMKPLFTLMIWSLLSIDNALAFSRSDEIKHDAHFRAVSDCDPAV